MSKSPRRRLALLAADPHCRYCGAELTEETATLSLIIPRNAGGSREPGNVVLACWRCQRRKGGDSPTELREWVGRVIEAAGMA